MPGLVPLRRSHSSLEEDTDERQSTEASDDDSLPQTGANKRARTTPEGGSRRTTGDSWRLDTPQTVAKPKQRLASGLRPSTAAAVAGHEMVPMAAIQEILANNDMEPWSSPRITVPLMVSAGIAKLKSNGSATLDDQSSEHHGMLLAGVGALSALLLTKEPPARAVRSRELPQHQPGSIIRVTLKDFVTYSNATFYPGPSLNMVIGPNGTGKSTLVCAICLGLGWSTQNLGRAKDVVEFIKHGTNKAIIEIELKGLPGQINPIIKRQIDHQKGGNHWWINGQASNEKSAKAAAEKFNIQIDNLCQFLPQDRVADFAKMTPVAKLEATIKAAATPDMIADHDKLKRLRKQQGEAEKDLSGRKSHLAALEKKQDSQRAEVDKIRERQQITVERDFVQQQKPAAEYAIAKEEFLASKTALEVATTELTTLKEEVGPSMRAIDAKEDYQNRVEFVCDQRRNLFRNVEKSSDLSHKKGVELLNKITDCENRQSAEKNARKVRAKKIAVAKSEIEGIEKLLQNEPPVSDFTDHNERRRVKQRLMFDKQDRQREFEASKTALKLEVKQKKDSIEKAEAQKVSLATEVGQRDTLLRSAHAQAHQAWRWIEQQQREGQQSPFVDKVYGPPILECSVTDESWAGAIESVFNRTELTAITCTNHEDFLFLSNKLHGELGLPKVSLREALVPLASFKPPIVEEEMRRLRISGWAINYLKGPAPVLAMLCNSSQPHKVAILQQEEDPRQYEQLSAHEQVDNWMTRNKTTSIKRRREYGATSQTTRNITQAQYWVSRPVDNTAIHDLDDNISGWQSEIDAIMAKGRTAHDQLTVVSEEVRKLEKELKQMDDDKNAIQRDAAKFKTLPTKLKFKQAELASMEEEDRKLTQTLQEITEEQGKLLIARGQCAIDYATIIQSLRLVQVDLIEAEIALLEAQSDVVALRSRNSDVTRLIQEREQAVRELHASTGALKTRAMKLKKEMGKSLEDAAFVEWLQELSEEHRNRTPDQIDEAIRILDARLDVLHVGSNNIITQFEARQREIEQLQTQVAEHDASMQALNADITKTRSAWEPRLDELIGQISDAFGGFFNKIKCAGEVSVFKAGPVDTTNRDDDFENWSIMLKVKFREHEELSILDSHRQSGGERAVSTMFYLMSLQRLSQAPFRVVDEINQGMDPRNERVVHSLMVDIACGEEDAEVPYGGSQYFLITPKLLTNLKFHPNMMVHCIVSGEYMPEDPMKLDIKSLIKKAAEKKRRGRAMDDPFGSRSGSVSVGA